MENNYGITKTMTREEFETYFVDNREIKYKNLELGIMDWGDGRFDVLKSTDNEQGYETLNPNPFIKPCDAINFAIDHLVNYSINRNSDGTQDSKPTKKNTKKVVNTEPAYNGPRTVKVFGRDIYIEDDSSLKFEDIRQKLVNEYSFPNFKKEKVFYDFDESTGTLEVLLKFQTKG